MVKQKTCKCLVCGRLFEKHKFANTRQKYCSLKCRSKDYYTKYYEHFTWRNDRFCENCGKEFVPVRINQLCCSPICRKVYWRKKNREKDLRQRREYNARRKLDPTKREIDKLCSKRWRQRNKDKKYSYDRAYRARKVGNGGSHTKLEWEALKYAYDYTCQICGKKEPEIQLTEDHIVPLTKDGTDDIENIQPLCQSCNSIKNDRILNSLPQINITS